MVGEIFKYQYSQIAKIAPKLSTMVGEIFKYQYSQIAKIAPKLSTIIWKFAIIFLPPSKLVHIFSPSPLKIAQIIPPLGDS